MSIFSSWFTADERVEEKKPRAYPFSIRPRISSADYLRPQRWNWSLITKPLDERIGKSSSEALVPEKVSGLRFFLLDGLFATVSDNFFINYVPLFALAYHATNSQLGLLAAVANLLGTLALFPGARAAERTDNRKRLVVRTGGLAARLAILSLALIPLFIRNAALAIALIILSNGLRSFMANYANPAWTSIVADLVPSVMRGRYFSLRNTLMGIAALVGAPLAGFLIRHGNSASDGFSGYQGVFLIAFLTGILSTVFFSRIHDPGSLVPEKRVHMRGDLRKALRSNLPFLGLVVSSFVWNLSIQISAPFFNIYLVSELGAGISVVGIAAGVMSLTGLAGQLVFGKLVDKRGNIFVQLVTGLGIPFLPVMWTLITHPWQSYLINAFGGFMWAGYNLSNFNLLLELAPEAQRPRAVALYQTVVFASAVAGPLLGGYLADAVNFHLIFTVSSIGRAAGVLLFLFFVARIVLRKTEARA